MVATATRRGVAHGFPVAYAWVSGNGGSVLGQAGADLAQNAVSAAYLMNYVRTTDLAANTPSASIVYGGDTAIAQVTNGDTLLNQFTLEYAVLDILMNSLFNESKVDSTFSNRLVHQARNPLLLPQLTWGFAFVTRLETPDMGADGPLVYATLVLPRCQVHEGAASFGQNEGGNTNFSFPALSITPKPTNKYPGGLDLVGGSGHLDLGVANGRTDAFWIVSRDNPVFIDAYKSDGIATTFDLTYTPASTDTSTDDGNVFIQYDDSAGSAALITPSDITGKTVTIAAPEADDIVTSIYQTALSNLKAA